MRHPTPATLLAVAVALAWFSASAPTLEAEPDSLTVEASEYEALITALDALGLSLDDPELQNLDNGELWAVIEDHAGKKRGDHEQASADADR